MSEVTKSLKRVITNHPVWSSAMDFSSEVHQTTKSRMHSKFIYENTCGKSSNTFIKFQHWKKWKSRMPKNLNKKITCDGGKNCWQYFSSCFFFNETTILFLLNTHVECCISPLKMSQSVKYFRKMLIWWIFFFPFSVVGMYLPICIYVPTCLSIYLIRLYFRYRTFSDSFSIYFTSLPNQFPGKNCIQLETN